MELLHADQTATTKFVQPLMSEQEFVGDTEADFLEAIVKETLDGFTTNDDSNEEDGEEKSPVPSPVANAVAIVAVPNTSVSKKKKKSKYTPEERLERRRHQNRNSMRAKRENQKEEEELMMQKLRDEVAQYESWLRWWKDLAAHTPHKIIEMNQLFSSIVEMSKEADHLRKQNEFWIAKVQDYQVFVDAIHQVQEEKNNDPQYRDMNAIEYQLDTESFERQNHWNHFRYSPKSDLELSQCVVQYTREIEALQQIHLEKEPFHQKDGWTMHMKEVEGDMIFLITRKYAHIDPHTAMERAWFHDTKTMDEYRKKQPNILRLQMLQEIQIPGFEDQTYMIGRDVEEQGIIFRTIYLFFRMATERGYLIGSQSLNPSPEEQKQQRLGSIYEDKLHWADASYSVEFNELDEMIHDAIGSHKSFVTQKGCEIVWRGRVAYKSAEMAKNRATKLFFAAVAWGSEVIDPTTTEPMLLQSQAK